VLSGIISLYFLKLLSFKVLKEIFGISLTLLKLSSFLKSNEIFWLNLFSHLEPHRFFYHKFIVVGFKPKSSISFISFSSFLCHLLLLLLQLFFSVISMIFLSVLGLIYLFYSFRFVYLLERVASIALTSTETFIVERIGNIILFASSFGHLPK